MTKDGEKLPEMTINNKDLQKELIRAIESKEFSAVVCDTIYLLLKDQNHNAGDVLLPIAQACQRAENTAFIGVAHLKKYIADQEVVHHIRGDSDIVTFARTVIYMREGKEKNQRVIVPLKNSFTGNLDTGFVTTMPDDDSALSFQHYEDNNFAILKEHGKPFSSFIDAPKDSEKESLILDIKTMFLGYGDGKWRTQEFEKWLNGHSKKQWNRMTRSRLLKKAGLKSEKVGLHWFLFEKN